MQSILLIGGLWEWLPTCGCKDLCPCHWCSGQNAKNSLWNNTCSMGLPLWCVVVAKYVAFLSEGVLKLKIIRRTAASLLLHKVIEMLLLCIATGIQYTGIWMGGCVRLWDPICLPGYGKAPFFSGLTSSDQSLLKYLFKFRENLLTCSCFCI